MDSSNRVNEIKTKLNAVDKKKYRNNEILPGLLELQKQMAGIVFVDNDSEDKVYKAIDIYKELERRNSEVNHVADKELDEFETYSFQLANLIKAEISGRSGENKVFNELNRLKSHNRVIKNIELDNDGIRTEIDAVVVTKSAISIIEVKNSLKNIYINEDGNMYRIGEYTNFDCELLNKMKIREDAIRRVLSEAGIAAPKIEKIVVFTNEKIEIKNECTELKVCLLGQLRNVIDSQREYIYSQGQFDVIRDSLEEKRYIGEYELKIDIEQLKVTFANLVCKLENSKQKKVINPVVAEVIGISAASFVTFLTRYFIKRTKKIA